MSKLRHIDDKESARSRIATEKRFITESAPTTTGRSITGYALKFGKLSRNLGTPSAPWFEVIEPGSLPVLSSQDVRCLYNHDPKMILARSKFGKGSLKLTIDSVGLMYQFQAPDNTAGNDLLESVKRGDIDESSFSFSIAPGGDEWTEKDGKRIRRIKKISQLHDVSPVTEPAYSDTSVTARNKPTTATATTAGMTRGQALTRHAQAILRRVEANKPKI